MLSGEQSEQPAASRLPRRSKDFENRMRTRLRLCILRLLTGREFD
jgi:hypothetical protein